MALKITAALTDSASGQPIPANSFLGFMYIQNGLELVYKIKHYYDQSAHDNDKPTITADEIESLYYSKTLTVTEYLALNPTKAHEIIQTEVESWSGIGSGNTAIVLPSE
jgi:hypothetical protein